MYLDEVKKDDKRIADAWKEGSNGVLVFVSPTLLILLFISMTSFKMGLFSAIVSAFIIEFYKQLSPNSGNQTVIPHANGTYTIVANPPSPPSASMIWVNAMWLISLVLSLASALIANLLKEWARRYVEPPFLPSNPKDCARVRSFLFLGTQIYKMSLIDRVGFTLLHISVYLFVAGLVIGFRTINKNVAIALEITVGVCVLAYLALSILPCLDVRCPFRTPISHFLWYPTHAFPSSIVVCLLWLVKQLFGSSVQPSLDNVITNRQRILISWLESLENTVRTHWRHVMDGIGRSVINSASDAQDGDRRIATRLFNLLAALDDEKKLRRFAASIPRDRVLDLIPPIRFGRIVLGPLTILLRSCAVRVAGPDEDERRRSLLVCLDAVHYVVKYPGVPDLDSVRANLANIGLMRTLWNDSNTSICVTSRSICAVLAKQVIREDLLQEPQLRWLEEVIGSRAVYHADHDTRKRMNLKSFVYGVLSKQEDDLSTEDALSFKETLAILLDVENNAHFDTNFQNRLLEEVKRIQQDDPKGNRDVLDKLRTMFLAADPFFPSHAV